MSSEKIKVEAASGGAWRTLEETGAGMSSQKLASERMRHNIGLFLGPILFILMLLIPLPPELTFQANLALAITVLTMTWWVTEPVPMPVTAIISIALFILLKVLPLPDALNQLGNQNTWLLMGTFIFMNAMVKHGFTTRAAFWLLSRPIGKKSPYALLSLYITSVAIISAFLSNMATTMLFVVISKGVIDALEMTDDNEMSKAMRFASAFGSQAGGFATPMGAAGTNFLVISLIVSLAGYSFNVVSWMKIGFPFMIVMLVFMIIYFRLFFKIKLPNYEKANDYAKEQLRLLGPMKKGEKRAVAITLLVMFCWLLPGVVSSIFGSKNEVAVLLSTYLNATVVAMLGGALCFFVPVDKEKDSRVINWTEANRYIDWGALLLVVCGMVMGIGLNAKSVGILTYVSNATGAALGDVSPIVAVLGITALTIVVTQFVSNIAAVSIMVPVAYTLAIALGLNPVALMMTIGFAAQQSYALPVSAPQMAFVYGTGGITIKEFVLAGGLLAILCIPITAIISYYLGVWLFPM